ncbi:hypothetical protein [Streptomyces sp. NPDC059712]|uniref:hypothetical protein n=1 Tax=Streptomyces sp. NPDC059712 TaxID=3346919 RepID=UPI0036AA620F
MTDPTTETAARERLQIMIRTDRGHMTVWSEPEVRAALDAYRNAVRDAASAVSLPPADQTPLRDRIAEALMRWAEGNNAPQYATMRRPETVRANAYSRADAVLAVLPATTDQTAEVDRLRTENSRMRHELEVMYGGAFDRPDRAQSADRAAVLREAADRMSQKAAALTEGLHDLAHFVAKDRLREAEILDREAAELRRVADETQPAETEAQHQPRRGDQFEAWLKTQRDSFGWHGANDRRLYDTLDGILDRYRLHADMGVPLDGHVCEARVVGDCECLEQPVVGCGECGHPKAAHEEGDDPVTPGQCADCPDDEDRHDYRTAAVRQDGAPLPTPTETAAADQSPHVYMDAVQDSAAWAHAFTKAGQMTEALEHVEAMERLLAVYRRAVGA